MFLQTSSNLPQNKMYEYEIFNDSIKYLDNSYIAKVKIVSDSIIVFSSSIRNDTLYKLDNETQTFDQSRVHVAADLRRIQYAI